MAWICIIEILLSVHRVDICLFISNKAVSRKLYYSYWILKIKRSHCYGTMCEVLHYNTEVKEMHWSEMCVFKRPDRSDSSEQNFLYWSWPWNTSFKNKYLFFNTFNHLYLFVVSLVSVGEVRVWDFQREAPDVIPEGITSLWENKY